MNFWARIKDYIEQHGWFICVAVLLGMMVSGFFLLNQSAGERWALDGLPLDDNWIHLVYARSLANEGWFFYNPGQAESGMSSPLWVIFLAAFIKMGSGPVFSAKVLSILFGILFSVLIYHLALSFKFPAFLAWIVGLFVLLEPNLSFARVSGMEVMLTGCALVAVLLAANERKYLTTGLMIALMVISRGELAIIGILVGAVLVLELVLARKTMELLTMEEVKVAIKVYLPALVIGGLWALYNFSVNGHPLPNTFYVKHYYGLGILSVPNLWAIWQGYFQYTSLMWGFMGYVVLLLWGFGGLTISKQKNVVGILTAFIPFINVYSLSINMKMGPENWNFFARRYLDFLLPLIFLCVVGGFLWVWRKVESSGNKNFRLGFSVILLTMIVLFLFHSGSKLLVLADEYSWNCRNIHEVDVAMGQWIGSNLPTDAVIGVSDAGAMRYFGQRETIDFLGLNDHRNIGQPLEEILFREQPDYVALFRSPVFDSWTFLTERVNFTADRNTILGGADLVLYQVNKNLFP